MIEVTLIESATAYDRDYYLWLEQTIEQLERKNWSSLDIENLIEEIKGLAGRDRRALGSYLMRICEHLLELSYWTTELERCARNWRGEVINFRRNINRLLRDSPSLKQYVHSFFLEEYISARQSFLAVSGLDENCVPAQPPFSIDEVLDQDYFGVVPP